MNKSNITYQKRINQVIDYINNNLDKSFSLEELATVACFSPFHFHRIFVAVTGETVNYFKNRVQLEKAARLLKFSKNSIQAIAIECGFSSPSTLSRSFKQYFETSPSAYRKSGNIENSKIRKELFPMNDYLVPMSEEELKAAFPVVIRDLPERKIAYLRVVNSYQEGVVQNAFEKMIAWAKTQKIYKSETIFGMSLDDPMTTPQEKYRYEVCLTIPKDLEIDDQTEIETMMMPKCKYATTKVKGNINQVATATHYLFNTWLINSNYEPEHQHGLEIFLDKDKVCDWNHFDLELCIPIKKLI